MTNFFAIVSKEFAKILKRFIERRKEEKKRYIIGALIYTEVTISKSYTKLEA